MFPPDTPLMASWRTRADDAGKRAMAHVQAQRLAAMMAPPTLPASTREGDVLVAPDGTCRSLSAPLAAMYPTTDAPTIDPRTVIDDRVTHLLNTEGEQFKARMWQQLSIRGMNDGRAHSILRKLGLTQ